MSGVYRALAGDKIPSLYLKMIWIWMALSSFVLIEPAPYDMLFPICGIAGLMFSHLSLAGYMAPPLLAIIVFINANILSLLFVPGSLNKSVGFLLITLYLTATWVFFIGLLKKYRHLALEVLFSGYTAAAVISVTVGIAAFSRLMPSAELFLLYDRAAGLFKDPNVFGPFLIPPVLWTVSRFEVKNSAGRYWWLGAAAMLSVGVLLSFSRAAWGNYLISVFLYYVLPSRISLRERILKLSVILAVMSLFFFFVLGQGQVNDLLVQRVGYHEYDNNRFGTQLASLKLAAEYPLGIGPYQTEQLLAYSTHSLYVRVLTEYGLLGLMSSACFLMMTIIRSLRHNFSVDNLSPYPAIITASLIGLLFNSFFIDTLHWRHFWLLLALPWIPPESGVKGENCAGSHQVR